MFCLLTGFNLTKSPDLKATFDIDLKHIAKKTQSPPKKRVQKSVKKNSIKKTKTKTSKPIKKKKIHQKVVKKAPKKIKKQPKKVQKKAKKIPLKNIDEKKTAKKKVKTKKNLNDILGSIEGAKDVIEKADLAPVLSITETQALITLFKTQIKSVWQYPSNFDEALGLVEMTISLTKDGRVIDIQTPMTLQNSWMESALRAVSYFKTHPFKLPKWTKKKYKAWKKVTLRFDPKDL